jgi:outer membrane protein
MHPRAGAGGCCVSLWQSSGLSCIPHCRRRAGPCGNIALEGVQEERRVGQRTTLDVLNSQQELLNAQVNRVTAERDLVVASYSLLSAIGRLTAQQLGLRVDLYQPEQHYRAVRDKWYGIRTPDGR